MSDGLNQSMRTWLAVTVALAALTLAVSLILTPTLTLTLTLTLALALTLTLSLTLTAPPTHRSLPARLLPRLQVRRRPLVRAPAQDECEPR